MAVGYDRLHDDRTPSPDDPLVPAAWVETGTADGSLATTAGDLAAFARFLLRGEARQLTGGRQVESEDGWSYGYGLERKGSLFRHGGSMPGFASTMLGDLDSGYVVAVLMNGPDEHDASEEVARFALDLIAARSLRRRAIQSRTRPTVHRPLRSRTMPHPTAATEATTPGSRASGSNSANRGSRLHCPGVTKSPSPVGEAEFRVGEEGWSPERLRFDAVVDGHSLRANLSGETYYRSDFAYGSVTRDRVGWRSSSPARRSAPRPR
jgi:hypothetical protein